MCACVSPLFQSQILLTEYHRKTTDVPNLPVYQQACMTNILGVWLEGATNIFREWRV